MGIFNEQDFYPTPEEVTETMIFNENLENKIILEPSAGKGDIVDVLKMYNPKRIIACETNKDLHALLSSKCPIIKDNFLDLTKEDVSHIDYIIANPPFSKQVKHITHMWDIAPEGCTILVLCNSVLFDVNDWEYSKDTEEVDEYDDKKWIENGGDLKSVFRRKKQMRWYYKSNLRSIIDKYGYHEELGNVFENAERKTNVKVSLIKLVKPISKDNKEKDEFDGFFDLDEKYDDFNTQGLIKYDEVDEYINRYIGAVRMFDEVESISNKINECTAPLYTNCNIPRLTFSCCENSSAKTTIDREYYKITLQKHTWYSIFKKLGLDRFVSTKVMTKINNQIEKQSKLPLTKNNVYKMLEMIIATRENTMKESLLDAYDFLTKYYYENREYHEGWKTNKQWLVGEKIILPNKVKSDANWQTNNSGLVCNDMYNSLATNDFDDFIKGLCFISGKIYNDSMSFRERSYNYEYKEVIDDKGEKKLVKGNAQYLQPNKWYDWDFFTFKCFKKGTLHLKWKDEKLRQKFNMFVAKAKGFPLMGHDDKKDRKTHEEMEVICEKYRLN